MTSTSYFQIYSTWYMCVIKCDIPIHTYLYIWERESKCSKLLTDGWIQVKGIQELNVLIFQLSWIFEIFQNKNLWVGIRHVVIYRIAGKAGELDSENRNKGVSVAKATATCTVMLQILQNEDPAAAAGAPGAPECWPKTLDKAVPSSTVSPCLLLCVPRSRTSGPLSLRPCAHTLALRKCWERLFWLLWWEASSASLILTWWESLQT